MENLVVDYISVNGQLSPYEDVGIAPGDAGLLHGAGLFETMRRKMAAYSDWGGTWNG